jgi:uncharacterized protein YggT (Ycf19 family)
VGSLDFTPILAFYLLYLLQELSYKVILTGYFSLELLFSLIIVLLFRFVYFILIIFIVAVGLRFILEIIGTRLRGVFAAIVYSLSEPAIRPVRRLLRVENPGGFDFSVLVSLAILILLRFLILPRLLALISRLFG